MGGLTCISFWTSHLCTLTYWGGGGGGGGSTSYLGIVVDKILSFVCI